MSEEIKPTPIIECVCFLAMSGRYCPCPEKCFEGEFIRPPAKPVQEGFDL